MKSYISGVVIFNEDGDKRYVDFVQGVNIITGDSKTGKSALVEIIDYCLCSSRSTIPKGEITDFGWLYCILLNIGNKCLVIAREKSELGGNMYIKVEQSQLSVEDLHFDYFHYLSRLLPKDVRAKIEMHLGLNVSNLKVENEGESRSASLRNMVSYMFQHQNLMASKFALFYRFNEYYKRMDIIEQFPVFAGIIDQEYYSSLIRLNSLKKNLKKLERNKSKNDSFNKRIRESLIPLFKDYYAIVNKPFKEDQSTKELIKLSEKLPSLEVSDITSEAILNRYSTLKTELEELRDIERDLLIKIAEFKEVNKTGLEYLEMLDELKEKTVISKPLKETYTCPLCDTSCDDLNKIKTEIVEASQWLEQEKEIAAIYNSKFIEDCRKLEEEKDRVVRKIKHVYRQIKNIEIQYIYKENSSFQERVSDAKARILFYVKTYKEGIFDDVDTDIDDLKREISLLEETVNRFDAETKINQAKFSISNNMNKIAKTLDFEDEYRPLNFTFDLEKFDLYHYNEIKRQKIFLSEMGSGANWVSCHIALFLSFLRYFTEQNDKSPMPLFLFFDQPSQVYFPQWTLNTESENHISNGQSDIKAVNMIYKTIFDEVDSIAKDTGITPQVIIVDHVDGETLAVKERFRKCTRRVWRDGKALI